VPKSVDAKGYNSDTFGRWNSMAMVAFNSYWCSL